MAWTLIYYTLELFKWLVIIRALMSWFVSPTSSNPLVDLIRRATDPILEPISRVVPPMGGFDITPVIAYFILYFLQILLAGMA